MFEYFLSVFTVDTMLALGFAVVAGLVIGILPGLSGTLAIALATPMTFGMEPIPALVMLTSFYTTATYGGSITAILLSTPGTPSSAATAQEGYELTKQGRGLEAIGWSTVASLCGGVFGGVMLLFVAPPLARFSLRFSSPEYFMIALFGLTIIGSLAAENLVKGLAAGAFGLLVGIVGMDANTAYARYTFGSMSLMSGIQMVPAMIGLFAISQMLVHAERLGKPGGLDAGQIEQGAVLSGRFLPSFSEFRRQFPLIVRASILGLFIGILPGAGGDIGSWVGYNEAKRSTKDKSRFGRGAIEGVIGSESANNAVCGGAYIPLFTLGIPGSGAAAVLLGGLLIHGLHPGNQLFTKNAHIVYPIIFGYILANILMCLVGVLIARKCAKVAAMPLKLIIPGVIVLATIGSYAINNSIFDIGVMLAFGGLGYIMRKSDFPTAPVVLGLILGPMAEKGLFGTVQMARHQNVILYILGRPLCVFFAVLIVLSLFAPFVIRHMHRKSGASHVELPMED